MSIRLLPSYVMIYLVYTISSLPIPRKWVYHLAYYLYYPAVLIEGVRRSDNLIIANLKHVFPKLSRAELKRLHKLQWKSQIYAIIFESPALKNKDYLNLFRRADPKSDSNKEWFTWLGLENLKAVEGRAVIFSVPHMHSLEIATLALSRQRPIFYIAKDPKDKVFARKARFNRDSAEMCTRIDRRNLIKMRRCLLNQAALLVLGDQYVRPNKPVDINFFGTNIKVQPTLARLAKSANAPVVPVDIHRTDDFRYEIVFQKPIKFTDTDLQHGTQLVFDHYERCIRKAPEQYIWGHNRFFR